jgi:hypothetical protein
MNFFRLNIFDLQGGSDEKIPTSTNAALKIAPSTPHAAKIQAALIRSRVPLARKSRDHRRAGEPQNNPPGMPDAKQLIAELRDLGVPVKMLTGDALPVAREIGQGVGLPNIRRVADL